MKEIKESGAKKVFIQYPEGLKTRVVEIATEIEKEGIQALICIEPTFGACDIRDEEAKRLGCDLILHIGHSDFGLKTCIKTLYWDYQIDVDPLPFIKKEFDKLKSYKRIGLVTSLQFVGAMEKVKKYLEDQGKEIFTHKSLKYAGQILGCCTYAGEAIEKKVDCFLYVGAGKFHPLGLAIRTDKPVFSLDLERKEIVSMEKEKMRYLKRKAWHEAQLEEAKRVAILVSWKRGQMRIEEAFKMKAELEKKGKEVKILVFDAFGREKIEGLKFDAFVNMICPRFDDEYVFHS